MNDFQRGGVYDVILGNKHSHSFTIPQCQVLCIALVTCGYTYIYTCTLVLIVNTDVNVHPKLRVNYNCAYITVFLKCLSYMYMCQRLYLITCIMMYIT